MPGTAAAGPGFGAHAEPAPGAPGTGDPYVLLDGNGGYDVGHYDLDLRYDPATDVLGGTAIAAQALSSSNLDLRGLDVEAVTVDDHVATWTRDAGELTITPRRALREGREFTTVVTYSGVPQTLYDEFGANGFIPTDDGAIVAGEPDGADTWFPSNDHPLDPVSIDVTGTVLKGLEALSNGVLRGQSTSTAGLPGAARPRADGDLPGDPGDRRVRRARLRGRRDPLLGRRGRRPVRPHHRRQHPAGRAGERVPGPPAEVSCPSTSIPIRSGRPAASSTRPGARVRPGDPDPVVYAAGFFGDPASGDLVVVHELANQWTGDLVRLARWQDIWLNEGFATYAEWLWAEHEDVATVQEQFDQFAAIPADDPLWTLAPGDPGPGTDQLFR
ncbi:M1 family aminopeptidase [Modestobacter sp. DSM 44400]|uniref:M1 family aminopeptidase n=1 Tax=Modestobacter sp. DSM 44400 TaxID=1550230 RepID=UPI001C313FD9|nr:M1 family aminopeptidase [Modestobacter sp. DSM 44400]